MKRSKNNQTELYFRHQMRMEVFLDFDPVFPGWPPVHATEEMDLEPRLQDGTIGDHAMDVSPAVIRRG